MSTYPSKPQATFDDTLQCSRSHYTKLRLGTKSPLVLKGQWRLGLNWSFCGGKTFIKGCFAYPPSFWVASSFRVIQIEGLIREEDEEIEADGANYQLEMMRCLREVNVDNNTVGW
ncbi:hypothetical protein CRYUN_Cryun06bG0099600 [Craigia yunnanensis]